MDESKPVGSSSSFTSELFGSRETSSANEIFRSIFSSSSKVSGKESKCSEVGGKRQDFSNEIWYPKTEDNIKNNEWKSQNTSNGEISSICQEQRGQPCHLSSSIYYGGQDVYSYPHTTPNSGLNPALKKDAGEDDSGGASRGNWWQGSLYY